MTKTMFVGSNIRWLPSLPISDPKPGDIVLVEWSGVGGEAYKELGWFVQRSNLGCYTEVMILARGNADHAYMSVDDKDLISIEVIRASDNRLERRDAIPGEQPGTYKDPLGQVWRHGGSDPDPAKPVEEPGRRIAWREFL